MAVSVSSHMPYPELPAGRASAMPLGSAIDTSLAPLIAEMARSREAVVASSGKRCPKMRSGRSPVMYR